MNPRVAVLVVALLLTACGSSSGGAGDEGCGPSNCAGCCFNDACQAGTTATACGKGGTSCSACTTGQVCTTAQACAIDPESSWKIEVVSANITTTDNGADWDGDTSAPDVKVFFECPPKGASYEASTNEVESITPTFSAGFCTGKFSEIKAQGITFQPFDIDVSSDDPISSALVWMPNDADFSGQPVELTGQGGLLKIRFKATRQ